MPCLIIAEYAITPALKERIALEQDNLMPDKVLKEKSFERKPYASKVLNNGRSNSTACQAEIFCVASWAINKSEQKAYLPLNFQLL